MEMKFDMDKELLPFYLLLMGGIFISAISQVMLKKSTLKKYDSPIKEYLNPTVITAYALFFITTFISVMAYKKIPLSVGAIIETTSYFYVTIFGVTIFHEKLNRKKCVALILIIAGVILYSFS